MNIVYLKDGRKANLVAKTETGYIVDPFIKGVRYEEDDEEEYEELSGNIQQVDEVYKAPPVALISEEVRQLAAKADELGHLIEQRNQEFNRAKYELQQIKKTLNDAGKMVINRSEFTKAKRLIVWIKGHIAPRIMDVKNNLKLTISYTISQYEATEKCWAYSCWSDNEERWSSYSEYFDPEYGIKTDLTDEEILSITHERQKKNEYDSSAINRADEHWLTPENLEKKKEFDLKRNERDLIAAENELLKIQEKVDRLRTKTTQPA